MGNTCCKTKVEDAVTALPGPDRILDHGSFRERLFRALGFGKFVAKVDADKTVDSGIEKIAEAGDIQATSRLFLRLSLADLIKRDQHAFSGQSSLIDIFDNEGTSVDANYKASKDTLAKNERRQEKVAVEAVTNEENKCHAKETNVDEAYFRECGDQAREATVADSVDETTDQVQAQEEAGDSVTLPDREIVTSKGVDDGSNEENHRGDDKVEVTQETATAEGQDAVTDKEDQQKIDEKETESTSMEVIEMEGIPILAGKYVLVNRPLSPEFFSVQQAGRYAEFGAGELDEEVEEEIVIEGEEDESEMNVGNVVDDSEYAAREDAKLEVGKGEVFFKAEDINAAMSRLAYLNEGLDPVEKGTPKVSQFDGDVSGGRYESNAERDEQIIKMRDVRCIIPEVPMVKYEEEKMAQDKIVGSSSSFQQYIIHDSDAEKKIENVSERFDTNARRKSDCLPGSRDDEFITGLKLSASQPAVETVKVLDEQEHETKSLPILCDKATESLSLSAIKSAISLASELSLETIRSHTSRSDCVMSVYVRSPTSGEDPRKVEVRASSKQVKDGSASRYVNLIRDIHLPPKRHVAIPERLKKSKEHLYSTPAIAVHEGVGKIACTQTKGPKDLPKIAKVPTYHEPTTKGQNSRERLGLDRLQKYKIGLQCKAIERIKIEADEFPGILPPKIRDKFREKVDKRKHMN